MLGVMFPKHFRPPSLCFLTKLTGRMPHKYKLADRWLGSEFYDHLRVTVSIEEVENEEEWQVKLLL